MEYYIAIKRNEILTHATTQKNLENTMLSKRSQTQMTTSLYDSIYMFRMGKSKETEGTPAGARGRRGGEGSWGVAA